MLAVQEDAVPVVERPAAPCPGPGLEARATQSGTVKSGNFVSFQTLIGFFLKKSFWYGSPFFFSLDVQNRGLGSELSF
jgi:hypothetical protein